MGCETCSACPFSFSDNAENLCNLGCLPSVFEIMQIKKETGLNWACHDDESKICSGYVEYAAKKGLDYKTGGLAVLSLWQSKTNGY